MPRKKGAVNYKNDVLIGIVEEILPNGQIAWEAVGAAYQKQSNEKEERDWNDIKKHWMKNLCNSMKKPTGSTGENGDRVCKCISIEKKIMRKTHSGFLGDSSAEGDYMPSPSGSDDVDGIGVGENVGGEFPGDDDGASDARPALFCDGGRFFQGRRDNQEGTQKHDESNPSCVKRMTRHHSQIASSKVSAVAEGLLNDEACGDRVYYFDIAIIVQ